MKTGILKIMYAKGYRTLFDLGRALLCGGAFVLFLSTQAMAAGPLDAISRLQEGIDKSNYDVFSNAIDVDSVLASASDATLAALKQEANAGNLGSQGAVLQMLLGSVGDDPTKLAAIKGLCLMEAKNLARAAVKGGYLAGKPNPSAAGDAGMFGSVLKQLGKDRKQVLAGKVLEQNGDSAVVSATFLDKKAGSFPLKLRMKQEQGAWRIKELQNVNDIVDMARKKQ